MCGDYQFFFKGLFAYVFVDLLYCIMIIDCISYFVWDVYSWVGGTDWPHKNWAPTSISDYVIRISSIYNVIDNNVSIQKFTWWFWWFFCYLLVYALPSIQRGRPPDHSRAPDGWLRLLHVFCGRTGVTILCHRHIRCSVM